MLMPDREYYRHSREAEEILGRIPSWTVRYGAMAVFVILVAVVVGCCFIKYPEKVRGVIAMTEVDSCMDDGVKGVGLHEGGLVGVIGIRQSDVQRIRVGQQVVVKLKVFPYMKYGVLTGEVCYLSSLPEVCAGGLQDGQQAGVQDELREGVQEGLRDSVREGQYIVKVAFPHGMVSSTGKVLDCVPGMVGDAEIITENKALILKVLDSANLLFQ